jgi:hypothetical protein
MEKRLYAPLGAVVALSVAVVALLAGVPTAHGAPTEGKVTPWDAMKVAIGKVPGGRAISATYASEGGHWIYDVLVVKGKALTEVEIDAVTGKVGDAEAVTPEEEGREMTAELNKALGKSVKEAPEKGEKGEKD